MHQAPKARLAVFGIKNLPTRPNPDSLLTLFSLQFNELYFPCSVLFAQAVDGYRRDDHDAHRHGLPVPGDRQQDKSVFQDRH